MRSTSAPLVTTVLDGILPSPACGQGREQREICYFWGTSKRNWPRPWRERKWKTDLWFVLGLTTICGRHRSDLLRTVTELNTRAPTSMLCVCVGSQHQSRNALLPWSMRTPSENDCWLGGVMAIKFYIRVTLEGRAWRLAKECSVHYTYTFWIGIAHFVTKTGWEGKKPLKVSVIQ